jgi:hypothetical protein
VSESHLPDIPSDAHWDVCCMYLQMMFPTCGYEEEARYRHLVVAFGLGESRPHLLLSNCLPQEGYVMDEWIKVVSSALTIVSRA